MKRHEDVLERLTRAVTIASGFVEAHHNIGCVLVEQKKFRQALPSLDKAITLKPDYIDALNSRGVAFQELRQFEQALDRFRAHPLAPD